MAAAIQQLELTMKLEGDDWLWRSHRNFKCSLQEFSSNKHSVNEKGVQEGALHATTASYVALLKDCAKNRDLSRGMKIHEEVLHRGFLEACFGFLVSMYVKCDALVKAEELLLQNHGNVYSWTELIAAYTRQNQGHHALICYEQMQQKGLSPDWITFLSILKACGSIEAITKGEQLHREIIKKGLLEDNVMLGTALVAMYAKCGSLARARKVFEELPSWDVVSWSALIQGYAQQGLGHEALRCYDQMQQEGLSPDAVTISSILKACGAIGAIDKGKSIHDLIARQGFLENNIVVGTALVDMYAKCGALAQARQVLEELPFRDVIAWNALITGYIQHDQGEQAIRCYERMQKEGLSPNATTFTSILKACGSIAALDQGEKLHDEITRQGLVEIDTQLGSALVDMYVKCGALKKAKHVLEGLPSRNVVSWSTLIAGYAQQGQGEKAFECYENMKFDGLLPDAVTLIGLLKACGSIGAADRGRQIHDKVARQGLLGDNIELGNALIDMYAKCGAVSKAQEVLENIPTRDVVSWNSLITGYAQHGQGEQALRCLEQMQREGLSPNAVTFICVLMACNHLGLVEDGHVHFIDMTRKYGIQPESGHFACMVDLFGRAGHLDKAVRVIEEMPSSDYVAVWLALLGACQKWENVEVGQWAFEHAVGEDECDATNYVHMANIYASAGMHVDAKIIEAMKMDKKAGIEMFL